jgi:hypothetical protein
VNYFTKITAFSLAILVSQAVLAQDKFAPLPDLTEENLVYQFQRCSGFYAFFSGLIDEELLEMSNPVEKARLQSLRNRANDNSDVLLMSVIVLMETLEKKSNAEAIDIAVDYRNGYSVKYLQHFIISGATVSNPFTNEIWKNDTASCGAIIENVKPLMKTLTDQ